MPALLKSIVTALLMLATSFLQHNSQMFCKSCRVAEADREQHELHNLYALQSLLNGQCVQVLTKTVARRSYQSQLLDISI